jgi:iron-sulfur cluster assembly protein
LICLRQTPNNNARAEEQKPRTFDGPGETSQTIMAIQLTKTAADRVRRFVENEGGIGLRLGVKKTGCSGWAYTVDLARDIAADDVVFEQDDVKVVVAPDSLAFLDGSTVDFRSEGLGSAFHFDNPNVTEQCGCGESFTIG